MKVKINLKYSVNKKLQDFLLTLPETFDRQGETIFEGSRNTIKWYCVNDSDEVLKKVVVKRFRARNIFQQLAYSSFRKSKAQRAYENGLALIGIDKVCTPYPIAYVEERSCGLLTYCYYLTAFTDASSVRSELEIQPFNRPLAKAFALFIASLHNRGIVHHDLNFSNVLFTEENGEYHISVIDINRMTVHPVGELQGGTSLHLCKDDFVRWTDDMQLFDYVMHEYAQARQLNEETFLVKAHEMKRKHNLAWKRRKTLTSGLHIRR